MKKISIAFTAILLALLIAATLPLQVFADAQTLYLSEVKIGMGKKAADAEAALAGYTILTDASGKKVDLNQNAGGGWGSKGDKVVYLGFKTTTDRNEAITDLALMNMCGGYDVKEYELLMEYQLNSQIIPFVQDFQVAIDEYRANLTSANEGNRARAEYVKAILDTFIDDDTGKGLGSLLVNPTKYEMGDAAYNALSDAEKKNHADILTILAQSNGKATLMLENLITRAADTGEESWLDRFVGIAYDDLVDALDMLPSDADAQLARLYDDDANAFLLLWEDFRKDLLDYDKQLEILEAFDADAAEEGLGAIAAAGESPTDEQANESLDSYAQAQYDTATVMKAIEMMLIHDKLEEYAYGDGTLLDFFLQTEDEISDDISVLYPLIASLSAGQRAGLKFVTLREYLSIAISDADNYDLSVVEDMAVTSIYDGVDRGIYEKGGVALTSDAQRDDAMNKAVEEDSMFNSWTIAMMAITGACFLASVGSVISYVTYTKKYEALSAMMKEQLYKKAMTPEWTQKNLFVKNKKIVTYEGKVQDYPVWRDDLYMSRATLSKWLAVGFGIATVLLGAVTTYLSYRDLVNYYKVDYAPIPHYMVDAKDITAYDENGTKIVLKNQAAYYKAAECNRKEGDDFFNALGTCADMNGDVGKQWLALYAQKSDVFPPILAKSLLVKVGDTNLPAGYKTGIHMFGASTAFDLNNENYVWNKDAKSVQVYFKLDESQAASTSGSNFTAGNLAIASIAGAALGALATTVVLLARGKKKKKAA